MYVFEVADYKFSVRFYEFKMADPIWQPCYHKISIKKGVSLHSQPIVRFREYFVYFLMRKKSKKSTIQKVLRTLILHINNSQKLLTN